MRSKSFNWQEYLKIEETTCKRIEIIQSNFIFSCTSWLSYLYSFSCPLNWCFSNSSINPMSSWIILFFLWGRDNIGTFSCIIILCFLINSHSISTEYSSFFCIFSFKFSSYWFFRLDIIKRRSKININISINYANSSVFIFRSYL